MNVFSGLFDIIVDTFRDDGETVYRAPGVGSPAVPCAVMLDQLDVGARDDDGSPPVGQMTLQVLVSQVPQPVPGGTFTIGARVLKVVSRPRHVDGQAQLWTMWVE